MALEFALGGALRGAGDTKSPLYIITISLNFFQAYLCWPFCLAEFPN